MLLSNSVPFTSITNPAANAVSFASVAAFTAEPSVLIASLNVSKISSPPALLAAVDTAAIVCVNVVAVVVIVCSKSAVKLPSPSIRPTSPAGALYSTFTVSPVVT